MSEQKSGGIDGAHNYPMDAADGMRKMLEYKAEMRRQHDERIAERKAQREAARKAAKQVPPVEYPWMKE